MFASLYDRVLARAEREGLADRRALLLAEAAGHTLEIGAGTGLNVARYPAAVTDLVLAEPDRAMTHRLAARVAACARPARVVRADAARLPFRSRTFDTAVSTLVLCSVRDPAATLVELRRVLRPRGRLLLLEHVRAADHRLARWQDRLNPLQRLVGLGCECNRPIASLVEEAGFEVIERDDFELPASYAIVRPAVMLVAAAGLPVGGGAGPG